MQPPVVASNSCVSGLVYELYGFLSFVESIDHVSGLVFCKCVSVVREGGGHTPKYTHMRAHTHTRTHMRYIRHFIMPDAALTTANPRDRRRSGREIEDRMDAGLEREQPLDRRPIAECRHLN